MVWASGAALGGEAPLPPAAAGSEASDGVSAFSRFCYALHGLPGFPGLQWDHVQDALGLTPDQRQQLARIGHQYYEAQQRDWTAQLLPRPARDEPASAERMRQDAALAQRYRERIAALEQQVKEALSPVPLEQCRKLERRQQLAARLFEEGSAAAIPLDAQQRQRIAQWRREAHRRREAAAYAIQQETAHRLQEILTPEQWEKLRALAERALME
jgi:hypothetical protein